MQKFAINFGIHLSVCTSYKYACHIHREYTLLEENHGTEKNRRVFWMYTI